MSDPKVDQLRRGYRQIGAPPELARTVLDRFEARPSGNWQGTWAVATGVIAVVTLSVLLVSAERSGEPSPSLPARDFPVPALSTVNVPGTSQIPAMPRPNMMFSAPQRNSDSRIETRNEV